MNTLLIERPAATFFLFVRGDGFRDRGISEGDILVIDRAAPLKRQSIAVVSLEGELLLRVIDWDGKAVRLSGGSPDAVPLVLEPGRSFQLWGLATYVLHPLARPFVHRFWKEAHT